MSLWNIETGQCLIHYDGGYHTGDVNGCAISPKGELVVSASDDGQVIVWKGWSVMKLKTLCVMVIAKHQLNVS
eukprot:CAMPEP_0201559714 /NCGR_PEP_ID=MMETSP0173_2-20130828/75896_1 /ASSEMBLY_ACC=CAM_ASM_000268 /TAXON_ID=218659 /ORGANISM="Vexillifera sp., Strain DIVA3 564/2" /LENGTH=72 /DNA_ID=CAMNT_0047973945 /DNA_START=531 /DNA_END=745 /DNA_ORIENTATION=-